MLSAKLMKICDTANFFVISHIMLTLQLIKEKPDFVIERLAVKGFDGSKVIAEILEIDASLRRLQTRCDSDASELKKLSSSIGSLMKQGLKDEAEAEKWYGLAVQQWKKKADEEGDSRAMRYLAICYLEGKGVKEDPAAAEEWYQKAAEAGNVAAQYELAELYAEGEHVEPNDAEARKWYEKAAEGGHGDALYRLAEMYEKGRGVTADKKKAREMYEQAILKESPLAMRHEGERKIKSNREDEKKEGFGLLLKAAEAGDTRAMNGVIECYRKGKGVKADRQKAKEWEKKRDAEAKESSRLGKVIRNEEFKKGASVHKSVIFVTDAFMMAT